MSLKAFHVFFILVCTVFAVGFGFWGTRDYLEHGNGTSLAMGVGAFLGSVALAIYSSWFLKKMKNTSFL